MARIPDGLDTSQTMRSVSSPPKTFSLVVNLTSVEGWNLAQFYKRAGFSDYRRNAENDNEAYAMRDAADRVRTALAEAGYAPR
jgi:hypothetical protein